MMFLRKARISSSMSAVKAVTFPRLRMLSFQKPEEVSPQSSILELELFKAKQELEASIFNNNLQRAEIQLKSEEIKLMTEEIKLKELDFLANQKFNLIFKENALKLLGIQNDQPSQRNIALASDLNCTVSPNDVPHDSEFPSSVSVVQMCQYLGEMENMTWKEMRNFQRLLCENKDSLFQFKEHNGCKYIVDSMNCLFKNYTDETKEISNIEITKYLDLINEILSVELQLLDVEDRFLLKSLSQHGYYKDVLHKLLNDDKYNIAIGRDIVYTLQQFVFLGYKNNNICFTDGAIGSEFILPLLKHTKSFDDISCDILDVLLDVNKSRLLTGDTKLYKGIIGVFENDFYFRFSLSHRCERQMNAHDIHNNEATDIRSIKQFLQFVADSKTIANREYLLVLSESNLIDCMGFFCSAFLPCDDPDVENCALFLVNYVEMAKTLDITVEEEALSDIICDLRQYILRQTNNNGEVNKRVKKFLLGSVECV